MDVPLFKVPSGEITNLPFLRHIARKKRPVILSTGMSTLGEVEEAVQVITTSGAPKLTLLHCVTEYPAPYAEVNLRAMETLKSAFGLPVGYSDHTPGIEIAIAAVPWAPRSLRSILRSIVRFRARTTRHPSNRQSSNRWWRPFAMSRLRWVRASRPRRLVRLPNISVARKSVVAARSLPAGHQTHRGRLGHQAPRQWLGAETPASVDRAHSPRRASTKTNIINWEHLA